MKLISLILILNLNIDSLPPTPQLLDSLNSFHHRTLEAELQAFEASPKDYWMNFVPSVGIGYNLQGQPRPTLSYSIASLINFRKQKRQTEAQRTAIKLLAKTELEKEQRNLTKLIQEYNLSLDELSFNESVFKIDEELFRYYEKKSKSTDLDIILKASDFLIRKKEFMNKVQAIRIEKQNLQFLKIQILTDAYFSF